MNESKARTLHYESRVVTRDYPNSLTTPYYMRLMQGGEKNDSRFEWTTGNILGATASLIICLCILLIFVVCLLQTIKKKLRNYRNGSQIVRDGLSPNMHTITSNTGEVSFINIAGNLVIIPSTEEPPPYEQALSSPRLTRLSKTNMLGINAKISDSCLPTYEDALKSVDLQSVPALSANSPPILSPATPAGDSPFTKSHSTIGLTNFAFDNDTNHDLLQNPNKIFEPNHDTPLTSSQRERIDYSARRSLSTIPPLMPSHNGWSDKINLLSKSAIKHIKQNLSFNKSMLNSNGQINVIPMTRADADRPMSQPLSTLGTNGLNSRLSSYLTEGSVIVQATMRSSDNVGNRITYVPTTLVSSAQNIPNFFIFPETTAKESDFDRTLESDRPRSNPTHKESLFKITGGNISRSSNLTYVTSPIKTNVSFNKPTSPQALPIIGDQLNLNNRFLETSTATIVVSNENISKLHVSEDIEENIDVQC